MDDVEVLVVFERGTKYTTVPVFPRGKAVMNRDGVLLLEDLMSISTISKWSSGEGLRTG